MWQNTYVVNCNYIKLQRTCVIGITLFTEETDRSKHSLIDNNGSQFNDIWQMSIMPEFPVGCRRVILNNKVKI